MLTHASKDPHISAPVRLYQCFPVRGEIYTLNPIGNCIPCQNATGDATYKKKQIPSVPSLEVSPVADREEGTIGRNGQTSWCLTERAA